MVYAFRKALGCDGNIGTIEVSGGNAVASDGHKVLNAKADGGGVTIDLESTRYPFCFYGDAGKPDDPKSPQSTREIIKYFPFNQDLNQFTLVVRNAPADKLRVTWGNASHEFTKDQLATGVNLAAEFLDNPFAEQFAKVHKAVQAQQNFETVMIKNLVHCVWETMPEEKDLLTQVSDATLRKQQAGFASGGEQQMIAIGRALMARPRLVLLDEPSMGLAPLILKQIFDIVSEINSGGVTVLLVEQNAAQALALAHRGYVLETGEIVLRGTGEELLADDRVRAAYLGEEIAS